MNILRKRNTLLALVFTSSVGFANAALIATDVAIIGYHSDTEDSFSWVALNTIPAGEVLYFSDSSYETSSSSFLPEGMMKLIVPNEISAGTVSSVSFVTPFNNLPAGYSVEGASAYSSTDVNGNPSFNFQSAGDQLVIFQDPDPSNPTGFVGLSAINASSTLWGGDFTNSATESDLYPGMTNGVNALAVGASSGPSDEFDNVRYEGPTTGSSAFLLSQIYDVSNWQGTNDSQGTGAAAWTANGVAAFVIPEPSTSGLLVITAGLLVLRRQRL